MSNPPEALWLSASPSVQGFDRPLLKTLSQRIAIAQWQYQQGPDEPRSLEVALHLLHDYLSQQSQPLHLLGHGTSGLLALLYAGRYPERVKSLTLLSVGAHPAMDWQFHYYDYLANQVCQQRNCALTRMVYQLFGHQPRPMVRNLVKLLDQDLWQSPSPHTLLKRVMLMPRFVPVPLLICGSRDDTIVNEREFQDWKPWLGVGDRLWLATRGRYFFHYFHPQPVSQQIFDFWRSLSLPAARLEQSLPLHQETITFPY